MKTIIVALLLVASCSPAIAQTKPSSSPNYITKTAPNYMSPKYESGKTTKSDSKSCVVVVEQNFFTKQPVQTVKCY